MILSWSELHLLDDCLIRSKNRTGWIYTSQNLWRLTKTHQNNMRCHFYSCTALCKLTLQAFGIIVSSKQRYVYKFSFYDSILLLLLGDGGWEVGQRRGRNEGSSGERGGHRAKDDNIDASMIVDFTHTHTYTQWHTHTHAHTTHTHKRVSICGWLTVFSQRKFTIIKTWGKKKKARLQSHCQYH